MFVDDDVQAPSGWLRRCWKVSAPLRIMRSSAARSGRGSRVAAHGPAGASRRRSRRWISGPRTETCRLVWGANMAIRASALARAGGFDESIYVRGDEEEWQRRLAAAGGRIRYVAGAGLVHRRTAADSTIRNLSRAAYGHGRAARRFDAHKGTAPPVRRRAAHVGGLRLAHPQAQVRIWDRVRRAHRGEAPRGAGAPEAVSGDRASRDRLHVRDARTGHGLRLTSAAIAADAARRRGWSRPAAGDAVAPGVIEAARGAR